MQSDDDGRRGDADLRARLQSIEAEHSDLLSTTIGMVSIGNAELAERASELEREADVIRRRLGEPTRHPPAPPRRRMVMGWVALCASVVVILALVLLLPH